MFWLLIALAASWETPKVPAGAAPPAGLSGMTAADCGACHADFYAEWQVSTHAHAWVDPQFQAELHKDPEVDWLCINCHTPAGDQQERISVWTGSPRTPEQRPNPDFSAEWQHEGITCATCHIRDGQVLGVYGDTQAPHPVEVAPILSSSDLCLQCHQAVQQLEDTLVCTFNTGVEWQQSGSEKTCQSCHMPAVERPLVEGMEARATRRHLWIGSKIPKEPLKDGEQAYYDLFRHGVDVVLDSPDQAAPGALVTARLDLTNVAADHRVPTGDPERYLWIELKAVDAKGQVIAAATHRVGQRWTWWPKAERLADNRIAPGETRSVPLTWAQPEGGVRLEASVVHWRISPANAGYHDLGDYPTHAVVSELERSIPSGG